MSYSRLGYMAIKAETTENIAVTPNIFVPIMSEDIVTEWGETPAMPVVAQRALNIRPLDTAVAAPTGTVNILIEPKTIGYFLKAVYGAISTGQLMKMSGSAGTWAVGNTVTGVTSAKTATVAYVSSEADYLLITSPSGVFTVGETIGNGAGATAVLVSHDATVYGHQFTAPQTSLPTFTIEFGFQNESYRYTGVRFNSISLAQSDNIVTAALGVIARSEFKHARVTAVTTSGAGAKTISLDQTTGLVASDSIKIFRPSTGTFLDFSATSVKTHTVGTIPSETSITVTNLETSLAVGDLLVLAPQTPSYTVVDEFTWIGGSTVKSSTTVTLALAATADSVEDFEMELVNEIEPRHGANGLNVVNRFPAKNFLKGLTGTGKINRTYTDPTYLDKLRNGTGVALQVKHQAGAIGSTIQYYTLDFRVPKAIFQPFNPSISEDDLLNQEMTYDMYYDSTSGYFHKCLLTNDVANY